MFDIIWPGYSDYIEDYSNWMGFIPVLPTNLLSICWSDEPLDSANNKFKRIRNLDLPIKTVSNEIFRSGIFFSLGNKAQNAIFNEVKVRLVFNLKLRLVAEDPLRAGKRDWKG